MRPFTFLICSWLCYASFVVCLNDVYIDNSAATAGDGTKEKPFKALSDLTPQLVATFQYPLTFNFKGTSTKYSAGDPRFGSFGYPEGSLPLGTSSSDSATFKTWEGFGPKRAVLELGRLKCDLNNGVTLIAINIDFVQTSVVSNTKPGFESFHSANKIIIQDSLIQNYQGAPVLIQGTLDSITLSGVSVDACSLPILSEATVILKTLTITSFTLTGKGTLFVMAGPVSGSTLNINIDGISLPNKLENYAIDLRNAVSINLKNVNLQSKAQVKITNIQTVVISSFIQNLSADVTESTPLMILQTINSVAMSALNIQKSFSSTEIITVSSGVNSVQISNSLFTATSTVISNSLINQPLGTSLSFSNCSFTGPNSLIVRQEKTSASQQFSLSLNALLITGGKDKTVTLFDISDATIDAVEVKSSTLDSVISAKIDGVLTLSKVSVSVISPNTVNTFLKAASSSNAAINSKISISAFAFTGSVTSSLFDLNLLKTATSLTFKFLQLTSAGTKDSPVKIIKLVSTGSLEFSSYVEGLSSKSSFFIFETTNCKSLLISKASLSQSTISLQGEVGEINVVDSTFDGSISSSTIKTSKLICSGNNISNLILQSTFLESDAKDFTFSQNTITGVTSEACANSFLKYSNPAGSLNLDTNSFTGNTPFLEIGSAKVLSVNNIIVSMSSNCSPIKLANGGQDITIESAVFSGYASATLQDPSGSLLSVENTKLEIASLKVSGVGPQQGEDPTLTLLEVKNSAKFKIGEAILENCKLTNLMKIRAGTKAEISSGSISRSSFDGSAFKVLENSEAFFKGLNFLDLTKIVGGKDGLAIYADNSFTSISNCKFTNLKNINGGTAVYVFQDLLAADTLPTYDSVANPFLNGCSFTKLKTENDGAAIIIDTAKVSKYYHSILDKNWKPLPALNLVFSENESGSKTDIALYSFLVAEENSPTSPSGVTWKNNTFGIFQLEGLKEGLEMITSYEFALKSQIDKVVYKGTSILMPDMLDPEFTLYEPNSGIFCTYQATIAPPARRRRILTTEVDTPTDLFTLLRDSEILTSLTKDTVYKCNSYINAANYWRTKISTVNKDNLKAALADLKKTFIDEFKKSNIYLKMNSVLDQTDRCYDETKKFNISTSPSPLITPNGADLGSGTKVSAPGKATWFLISRLGILKDQVTGNPNNAFLFQNEVYSVLPMIVGPNCKCESNKNQFLSAGACKDCPLDCIDCRKDGICKKCINDKDPTANICTCDSGFYVNATLKKCDTCDRKCKECSGSKYTNCLQCPNGSEPVGGVCTCLDREYLDKTNKICSPCSSQCLTCSGPESNQCVLCPNGLSSDGGLCSCEAGKMLFKGQCITKEEAFSNANPSTVMNAKSVDEVKSTAALISQVLEANSSSLALNQDYSKGSPCGENSKCSGNGNCQNDTTCVCSSGFAGTLCQYKKESLQQVTALSEQVSSQLVKLTDPTKVTAAEAKSAVDTIATITAKQDALSSTTLKNVMNLLESLQSSKKLEGQTSVVLNCLDNILQTVNDYPISMGADERKALAQRATEGFSKAIESDLKTNKENLKTSPIEYKTSSVDVVATYKNLTAASGTRLLQGGFASVTIPDDSLKAIAKNNEVVVQIERWVDNPKNAISAQEISTEVFSIKVLKFADLSSLTAQSLANPIKIVMNRKFGKKSENDTCFYFDDATKTWNQDGVTLASNSDTSIECTTNHLTIFGAGAKGKAVVLISNNTNPDPNPKPTTGQVLIQFSLLSLCALAILINFYL